MLGRAVTRLRLLRADRSANVAIITAFAALPIIGMIGFAIDYALALSTKSKLDAAADTAVIAAITKAKSVYNGGGAISDAIAQGQAQGLMAFRANAGSVSFLSNTQLPVPDIKISPDSQNPQLLNASITYSAGLQTQFGALFNARSTTLNGKSSSSTILTPYYQFIFVVDRSGSMAIGGTSTDINGLTNDPNIRCAFACHDPSHNRGPDYRTIAKTDGWTLKIDYVNQAVQNFIQDLDKQTKNIPGVFSVGIYEYASTFYTLQTPINPPIAALAAATKIDIEPMAVLQWNGVDGQGYTRTTASLKQALAQVSNIGDGTSAAKQKTYFIFLSDGVEDIEGNMMYSRGTDVSYGPACQAMTAAGASVFSIVAPYPPINDDQYRVLVAPIAGQLTSAMKNCATTPSMAYQADDGPGINTAVQSALQQVLQGLTRLTQ